MIVTDPDQYLLPVYRMSPFSTGDVHKNARLPEDRETIEVYFKQRFLDRNYAYTSSGKAALYEALNYFSLAKEDVVTIFTTTDNFYISSCVTNEVEKFCGWSRKIEANTKILLINHEFGYPRTDLDEFKKMGFPIIEDCAYTFFPIESHPDIGKTGEFTIYSLPKLFPIQIGGLLSYKSIIDLKLSPESTPDEEELIYIQSVLSYYIKNKDSITNRRQKNYKVLINNLKQIGCEERLPIDEDIIPGACLFRMPDNVNLQDQKDFLNSRGIQCSVFYGEQTFFLPVHQRLNDEDVKYISDNLISFIKSSKVPS